MKKKNVLVALVLPLLIFSCKKDEEFSTKTATTYTTGTPAFPGAQGFAKFSKGGRGGDVIYVTNLNDDGEGSLRAALQGAKPRNVLFKVAGVIELKSKISINNPYITIAGHSAPGDGICVKGSGFYINANDVVIQHLRFRPGDGPGEDVNNRDGIDIGKNASNVMIDHCSISWAIDENIALWDQPENITVQNCIISEALHNTAHHKGKHSMGLLIGDGSQNITIHNNLFISNNDRNPRVKGGVKANVTNNIIYNWGEIAAGASIDYNTNPISLVVTKNVFNNGPSSGKGIFDVSDITGSNSKIYLLGNEGDDEELIALNNDPNNFVQQYDFLVDALPNDMPNSLLVEPSTLEASLVPHVGASKPSRDAVDARVLNDLKNGTGKIIDSPSDVGGYPNYLGTYSGTDADNDGMDDTWELNNGLDPNNSLDGKEDKNNDGITNLEDYLHSLL